MQFKFANRKYAVPKLLPRMGEIVLNVERYAQMPLPRRAGITQFTYQNPIRKLLFFLCREGIVCTLRKAFYGGLLYNRILRERKIYCVYGINPDNQRHYIGLCTTAAVDFDEMTIAAAWAVEVPGECDWESTFNRLAWFLRDKDDWLEAIFRYSPFAGKTPPFQLAQVMAELPDTVQERIAVMAPSAVAAEESKHRHKRNPAQPDLFLIGAGVYACGFILQFLRGTHHRMLIDADPVIAAKVGELFHFEQVDTDADRGLQALAGLKNAVLCVATYHSTHMEIVEKALTINPSVRIFLEKPPVTTFSQLNRLLALRNAGADIEIGYNRRSLKVVRQAKRFFADTSSPYAIAVLVKELNLPDFHWYYWPNQKTRVTGNLCHWIDLGCFFITARPVEIFVIPHPAMRPGDEINATILFADGSKISLHSTDLGDPLRGVQEYLDIRNDKKTVIIDDFLRVTMSGDGIRRHRNFWFRNKGHSDMYKQYTKTLRDSRYSSSYSNEDLLRITVAYLTLSEMCLRHVIRAKIEWEDSRYFITLFHADGTEEKL
jgi:predicted dehydrogenase